MVTMLSLLQDIGAGKGKYYAVNYPLRDGIDDESYEAIFKPVSLHMSFFPSSFKRPVLKPVVNCLLLTTSKVLLNHACVFLDHG